MKERILRYRERIDWLLEERPEGTCWQEVLQEHLVQISFFQHERLIHLIVTITFALMTIISLFMLLITGQIAVIALLIMLLVLLVPYIMHYYLLENETQNMYNQYDKLIDVIASEEKYVSCAEEDLSVSADAQDSNEMSSIGKRDYE